MHTYCTKQVVCVLQAWRPDKQLLISRTEQLCVWLQSVVLRKTPVACVGMVKCDTPAALVETQ